MSADNWTACPRCLAGAEAAAAARAQDVAVAYGKVPADEYLSMLAEVDSRQAAKPAETFREDYEIYGAETGTLTISYGGECQTCGLTCDFQREIPFYPEGEVTP
jgi:hypothetical protein